MSEKSFTADFVLVGKRKSIQCMHKKNVNNEMFVHIAKQDALFQRFYEECTEAVLLKLHQHKGIYIYNIYLMHNSTVRFILKYIAMSYFNYINFILIYTHGKK